MRDQLPIGGVSSIRPSQHSVTQFGALGNGITDDRDAIVAGCSAGPDISGRRMVYFPPGIYRVANSFVVPPDVTICLAPQAQLALNAGVTVEVAGLIDASPTRHFVGRGIVRLVGRIAARALPQWWGALGDGATDDTAALQAAIDAAAGGGWTVHLGEGVYPVSSTVALKSGVRLEGAGRTSVIRALSHFIMMRLSAVTGVSIKHLTLDGGATATQVQSCHQIAITDGCSAVSVRNCSLVRARYSAIHAKDSSFLVLSGNQIDNPAAHGIDVIGRCTDLVIENNKVMGAAMKYGAMNASGKGIAVQGLGGSCERASIRANVVSNCRQVHIEVINSRHISVRDRVCRLGAR
jgi:polygalacturonase